MSEILKPDMSSIWASGGAILTPSPAKVETGWTAEIPPHQWENYVQNRQDTAIAYLLQKGIPEWDATTEYQANKSFVQHSGVIYKAKTTNTNKQPNTNPSDWSDVIADAIAVIPKLESKTFSQIDALSSDIGPIICTDMGGYLYTWQTSAYFTGYRNVLCGNIPQTMAASARDWELPLIGGTWNTSDPKHKRVIAWFREQGLTIDAGSWAKGFGYIADLGSGNWKAPDLRDVFLRMAGTDADTANPRVPGEYQADAIQNITGNISGLIWTRVDINTLGAFGMSSYLEDTTTTLTGGGAQNANASFDFDASRVVRASVETRSASMAMLPVVLI